ncbi:hypothetical protein [Xanthomonas sp. 3498]|uniref:hypothetical protein n=1 Tax=Xanthomonas sp. 3498 TaxID=2663863 RepID=UPI001617377A|nr:hypothetical protein [Xanthomonas sp. 3498]MBB5875905.1 hypothetical protein [Xanthomonas sp. 3498]
MDELLAELQDLIAEWDQEAADRHRDGMDASAATLRACRDELRRLLKRHAS